MVATIDSSVRNKPNRSGLGDFGWCLVIPKQAIEQLMPDNSGYNIRQRYE